MFFCNLRLNNNFACFVGLGIYFGSSLLILIIRYIFVVLILLFFIL